MKKTYILAVAAVLLLIALMAAGCSSVGSGAGKTYKWGNASFRVKEITDDESATKDNSEGITGKCVVVKIDFGDDTISQTTFEENVQARKFLLDGRKPVNYNYHMDNMVFESSGLVAQMTGEAELIFDMDKDYEINEDDLEIQE